MSRTDDAGAVAAAEYFLQLVPYVMSTGDLREWSAVTDDECSFCTRVADDVTAAYSEGGRYVTGGLTASGAASGPRHPLLGGFPVTVTYTMGSATELNALGQPVATLPEESGTVVLDVLRVGEGWVLIELSNDPKYSVFTE